MLLNVKLPIVISLNSPGSFLDVSSVIQSINPKLRLMEAGTDHPFLLGIIFLAGQKPSKKKVQELLSEF